MLKLIRNHLLKIVEDLDTGNSNLSDEEEIELLNLVVKLTDKTKRLILITNNNVKFLKF